MSHRGDPEEPGNASIQIFELKDGEDVQIGQLYLPEGGKVKMSLGRQREVALIHSQRSIEREA